MEKPNSGKSANVPTNDTGTASTGINVARQRLQENEDDDDDDDDGFDQSMLNFLHAASVTARVVSSATT